uniref:Core domain-containing protein n=1 Tax=Chromera velia CCMP2878 TaxID=1169474 RepID=A0A0G4HYX8_9ALVE|mmetsp:Transcript_51671/g.101310  ORF Transcript_51671/g.101310 Transcript_51671/m.101310 type:complete len:203 (+) Transcript_51671:174-782(+)|eukprot:Cvel_9596.t1-p1 / transcript=Cvel_9596.t1 / gene=Cvel_9596 / organism=Chromera_velia_CCMP2878 / gene_product=Iron-sulfur assembly protein IscA-like 2,, putative / transcript_product=Iron-sulfur assembly protein IscA-like 2,, putative / location=Cvel_scaffold557:21424-22029(+) / protein_length=202 / sequence_SO=supercontig / SO=protein_coding / is_pseudo=false
MFSSARSRLLRLDSLRSLALPRGCPPLSNPPYVRFPAVPGVRHQDQFGFSSVSITESFDKGNTSTPISVSSSPASESGRDDTVASGVPSLSDGAVERLKELGKESQSGEPPWLRLMVESGGCAGFQYSFTLIGDSEKADALKEDDRVFEKDGCKLVVDEVSIDLLGGCAVDWMEEMIRSSFAVKNNDQAASTCSCGHSFDVR